MSDEKQINTRSLDLHQRRITMPDGRYMVFFTFTDEAGHDMSEGLHGSSASEPTALEPQASEERNV